MRPDLSPLLSARKGQEGAPYLRGHFIRVIAPHWKVHDQATVPRGMREIGASIDARKLLDRCLLGGTQIDDNGQRKAFYLVSCNSEQFGVGKGVTHGVRANVDAAAIKMLCERELLWG